MKIANISNSLSFKKKLEAKCHVLKNNYPYKCSIYSLNQREDADYFLDYNRSIQWKNSIYWRNMDEELREFYDHEKFYVMEDKDDNCLGFIKVRSASKSLPRAVIFFETNPQYANDNKNRNIKYVGETLLAFVTKLAKKEKSPVVNICVPTSSSIPFYKDKCGFEIQEGMGLILPTENYKNFIAQNEDHTGKKIWLKA